MLLLHMMGIQLNLIRTMCIVFFGLTQVQSQNQMIDQADVTSKLIDKNEIRENFQNLFDSMAKSNMKKSNIYHEILKQDVEREQEAFDTMRGELQTAQNRNAHKKRNFYKNNKISENVAASKRETNENDHSSSSRPAEFSTEGRPESASFTEDDKFVQKFGNDNTSGLWEPVRNIMENNEKILNICMQANALIFREPPELTATGFYVKELNFPNSPQYQPVEVDIIVYDTSEIDYETPNTPNLIHFTKGLEPHCIYHLVPIDEYQLKVRLRKHVCGLRFPFDTTITLTV